MTRRTSLPVALCLAAILVLATAPALAKSSQEMPAQTGQPEAQPATAMPATPQAAAQALSRTVQAVNQHNQATAAAAAQAEAQMAPGPAVSAAPAPKPSGKAIYGDIIIHK